MMKQILTNHKLYGQNPSVGALVRFNIVSFVTKDKINEETNTALAPKIDPTDTLFVITTLIKNVSAAIRRSGG